MAYKKKIHINAGNGMAYCNAHGGDLVFLENPPDGDLRKMINKRPREICERCHMRFFTDLAIIRAADGKV